MSEIKPGDFAREYAARFPDVEGELKMDAFRPKGKGGWGRARSTFVYYFSGGRAAQTRGTRKNPAGEYTNNPRRNGMCQVCGRVFLTPVLAEAHAPHPLAGQEYPVRKDSTAYWEGFRHVYAEKGSVTACMGCVAEHGLEVSERFRPYERTDNENRVRYFEGSVLVNHPAPRAFIYVDLTGAVNRPAEGFDYVHRCPWCSAAVSARRGEAAYCARCGHRGDAPKSECDCPAHKAAPEAARSAECEEVAV